MNWRQAGVWAWRPQDLDAERIAALMDENGFGFLLVQLHNGLAREHDSLEPLAHGWLDPFRRRGISIGGWGFLGEHPEREASFASHLLRQYGLSTYVADVEGPHKGDWHGGDPRRSDVFTKAFRALRPRARLGFAPFGAAPAPWVLGRVGDDPAGPMHFTPWARAGAVLMPQAYPNEYGPVYEPVSCIEHARRANWPLGLVHLVVGNYNGWHADDYVPRLRQARAEGGSLGFSVFDAENMTDADFRTYGEAIRDGLAEAA